MKTLLATTALIVAASSASALTYKNEYQWFGPCSCQVLLKSTTLNGDGEVVGSKVYVDLSGDTPVEEVRKQLATAINKAVAQKREKTEAEKAQNALNAEYRQARRDLEAYYNKYDLDTGLIDTDVQAGIDAAKAGDFELAQLLAVEFWQEYMINPERNVWERDDYKATEPLTQRLVELQLQGADY